MSTALMVEPAQKEATQLIITVTPKTIQEATQGLLNLKINGIEDVKGREEVTTALKRVIKLRTTAEKERVSVKADALEECKRIDKRWKDLFALIEPIEKHLAGQENAIKKIEADQERDRIQAIKLTRQTSLTNIGFDPREFQEIDFSNLGGWSDDQFNGFMLKAAGMVSAKRQRDAEQAQLKLDREKLERERIAQQEALDKQREEIDRQQAELREQREAAEKLERDRKQQEADAQLEKDRIAKLELLKPDHEKLLSVIDQLSAIEIPEVSTEGEYAKLQVVQALQTAWDQIQMTLNGMVK